MARNSGSAAIKDHANGHDNGIPGAYDAPPSTSAVQLINNLSTVTKPIRQTEQDDLQKLMSEVSGVENGVAEFKDFESKLDHQHKLIYVFTLAVLERLSNDDPFLDVDQLVLQATEAIEIFISIIKETPTILYYVVKQDSRLLKRGPEPFWIWLFPRVLALLGRKRCDPLVDKIGGFFVCCFEAASRMPKFWKLTSSMFCYLKESVSSMSIPLIWKCPNLRCA